VPSCSGFDQSSSGFTPQQKGDCLTLIPEIDDFRATVDNLLSSDWSEDVGSETLSLQ